MSLPATTLEELRRFERFQLDAAQRLASDPLLSRVKVFPQLTGDTDNMVLDALGTLNEQGGRIGACIQVLYLDFDITNPNAAGVTGEMVLTARCLEAPFFNVDPDTGTGITAGMLAMRTLRVWSGWTDYGVTKVVEPKGTAVEAYLRKLEQGIRGFDVTVRAPGGVSSGDKVARPSITAAPSGGDFTITLATTTADAAIYYTTNQSYPGSGNAEATLYTTPFTVPAGTIIRAGAEHPQQVPSDPNHKTV